MEFQQRYHIRFHGRRTTVTVDRVVSELLAVKLGVLPDDPAAHGLVRLWLEETLQEKLGMNVPGGNRVSQYARMYAIEALAEPGLMWKVWGWRLAK